MKNARILAACGKGGVGKTSLSAFITRVLIEREERRVLAIDADPASGLAGALGFNVSKTVDDIRNELIRRVGEGAGGANREILSFLDYEVFGAIEERDNLAFLAIGRPETDGCYCQVNELLKEIISSIAENFDFIVIDGEAGIEQINRRVMEKVNHLVLVSDASAKGLAVAKTIGELSRNIIRCDTVGLIINRLRGEREREGLNIPQGMEVLGWVPEDDAVRNHDILGLRLLDAPECPALASVRSCLMRLGVEPLN